MTPSPQVSYGYDTAGRLGAVTEGARVATLGYKPLTGAHQSTTITVSGTARYATARGTDALGRIALVEATSGSLPPAPGTLLASRAYTYDAANQRTEVLHEDALRWAYAYDALGQVTSAQKRNASSALLPGYDQAYAHDTIGNRVSTTTNGLLAAYTPDLRNQYASRTVPPALDVLGSVPPYTPLPGLSPTGANILVDGERPARSGELFHRAVPVSNAAAPAFKIFEIIAARPVTPEQLAADPNAQDQVATETRGAFVPQTPETFLHDLDGNLTQDGRWDYLWDAENRLVEMSTRADVASATPGLTRQKLTFTYDAQGRRIRKQTSTWNGAAYVAASELRFLYDGWNLLAELQVSGLGSPPSLLRSHVWGLDLSGSAQGAGGVGGLLWTTVAPGSTPSPPGSYAPAWDANGNIVAWIDLANGAVSGRRDYGAFGEPLVATGDAVSLPFAFSTKYRDCETELYYYGFRYYNPSTGRWLSRDPIGERGGLNQYGMVGNDSVNASDLLGLVINDGADALAYWKSKAGGTVAAGDGLITTLQYSIPFLTSKQETREYIEKDIRALGRSALCPSGASGKISRSGGTIGISNLLNWSVGSTDLDVKPYDVNWKNTGSAVGYATIEYTSSRSISFKDTYAWNASWNKPKTWLSDSLPEIVAGDGASFDITGSWTDEIRGKFSICCWFR